MIIKPNNQNIYIWDILDATPQNALLRRNSEYFKKVENLKDQSRKGYEDIQLIIEEFKDILKKWKKETSFYSMAPQKISHPLFNRLLTLTHSYPNKIVPIILEDLREKPSHSFLILEYFTRQSPVDPNNKNNIRLLIQDWLRWGESKGYL